MYAYIHYTKRGENKKSTFPKKTNFCFFGNISLIFSTFMYTICTLYIYEYNNIYLNIIYNIRYVYNMYTIYIYKYNSIYLNIIYNIIYVYTYIQYLYPIRIYIYLHMYIYLHILSYLNIYTYTVFTSPYHCANTEVFFYFFLFFLVFISPYHWANTEVPQAEAPPPPHPPPLPPPLNVERVD